MSRKEIAPGCWIDVFEHSGFKGRHRRLFGPGGVVSLRSSDSAPPGIRIASLIVGQGAHVRLYNSTNPENCRWFVPQQGVQDLREARVGEELDSIQIRDTPPRQGEPGYQAFVANVIKDETHG
jgi:hypothetical protein